MQDSRVILASTRRVVIKVGTRVLVASSGKPSATRLKSLVRQISALKKRNIEVVLVTSGAVGSGMSALKMKKRPSTLPELQMAAAVGQSRLMSLYDKYFSAYKVAVGQVLLTHDDLKNRERHLNVRNTINKLLERGVVPIINENDAVAVDELKFGENDILASLVTLLVEADLLLLLSTVNGLQRPDGRAKAKRVSYISSITKEEMSWAGDKGSELSVGGMKTKLLAAQTVVKAGGLVVIADGRKNKVIEEVLAGKDVGTLFGKLSKKNQSILTARKRWIAFYHRTQGDLYVDEGAVESLTKKGRSLLPIGIKRVEGSFVVGALVNVNTEAGELVARGIVEYDSAAIQKIKGCKTSDIANVLGVKNYDEVIHRDNMVLMLEG